VRQKSVLVGLIIVVFVSVFFIYFRYSINNYSGAIIAFLTLALVTATIVYVHYTNKLWEESLHNRLYTEKPLCFPEDISFIIDSITPNVDEDNVFIDRSIWSWVNWKLYNYGNSHAINIYFRFLLLDHEDHKLAICRSDGQTILPKGESNSFDNVMTSPAFYFHDNNNIDKFLQYFNFHKAYSFYTLLNEMPKMKLEIIYKNISGGTFFSEYCFVFYPIKPTNKNLRRYVKRFTQNNKIFESIDDQTLTLRIDESASIINREISEKEYKNYVTQFNSLYAKNELQVKNE